MTRVLINHKGRIVGTIASYYKDMNEYNEFRKYKGLKPIKCTIKNIPQLEYNIWAEKTRLDSLYRKQIREYLKKLEA